MATKEEQLPLVEGRGKASSEGLSVNQTTVNMINCFIGAGILTVPFAFRLAGYGAVIALVFVALMNWITALLLGKALEKATLLHPEIPAHAWDMPALARAAFGPIGQRIVTIAFALELWFALETFIVLTGINVQIVTGLSKGVVIIVAGTIGTASLSCPPSVVAAGSLLSVLCMAGGLLALVVCGRGSSTAAVNTEHDMLNVSGLPGATAMFLYCFSGLPCLPNIRAAMRRPKEEYATAVHRAFAFALPYYTAMGVLGYHIFARGTQQSFTRNLMPGLHSPHRGIYAGFALLASGLFAAKLQVGFPLYAAPVLGAFGFEDPGGLGPGQRAGYCQNEWRTWVSRVIFAVVSIFFALLAQETLDAVAQLMGAFLTTVTSLLFPCASYAMLCRASGERLGIWRTLGLTMMAVFGVVFAVHGTARAARHFWAEEIAFLSLKGVI